MSTRDHRKFLQIMARLRDAAGKRGERAFAEAASECIQNASRNPNCPLGRLILADENKAAGSASAPELLDSPAPATVPPCVSSCRSKGEIIDCVLALMQNDALTKHDLPFVRALRECQHFIHASEDNICPIRWFLRTHEGKESKG